MTYTRALPDYVLDFHRRLGLLICRCLSPVRIHIGLFDVTECARCGKKVVT